VPYEYYHVAAAGSDTLDETAAEIAPVGSRPFSTTTTNHSVETRISIEPLPLAPESSRRERNTLQKLVAHVIC
jgi:hypothetical protein